MNKRKENRMNKCVEVINFVPALIFGHIYILVIDVLYFPIAYIKAL